MEFLRMYKNLRLIKVEEYFWGSILDYLRKFKAEPENKHSCKKERFYTIMKLYSAYTHSMKINPCPKVSNKVQHPRFCRFYLTSI